MNPALVLALGALAAVQADPFDEGRFYAVDYLTPPDSAVLEVGGMDFLPDGKLVVSTRRGEVWMVENPLADDPAEARFSLFAEGLWEGLGLAVVDGEIFVLQRGELSRLRDVGALRVALIRPVRTRSRSCRLRTSRRSFPRRRLRCDRA